MSEANRNELIDAYFQAMDEANLEIVRSVIGDDFVYESLAGDLDGFAGLKTYMAEHRSLSNTDHEITLRAHDEDASVAEGTLTGESENGAVEADFCNVFEFGDELNEITRIGVYLNDS